MGQCQNISARRSYNADPIYGVGQWLPAEIIQQRYIGQFTVDKFFIRNKDLSRLGLAALSRDILRLPLIDIVLIETSIGRVEYEKAIRIYKNCICHEYSETIRANAIAGEAATWIFQSCTTPDKPVEVNLPKIESIQIGDLTTA